jgi:Tol biopolymer transport system component
MRGDWVINPPRGTTLATGGVLSPDGRWIAFVAIDSSQTRHLWVEPLGSTEAQKLSGTDGAKALFWSSDSKSITFATAGELKRRRLEDNVALPLADVSNATLSDHGGALSAKGVVLYPAMVRGPLQKLKPDGIFEPVTRLEPGERVHVWPSFLPDGRHFLYRAAGFDDNHSGTYVGSLDSLDERTRLEGVTSAAVYASGYLLFVREGALVAQRFDSEQRRLEGVPITVAANVAAPIESQGMTFSASGSVLSFVSADAHSQLEWLDRAGRRLGALEKSTDLNGPSLSPDDKQVLVARPRPDVGTELWMAPTRSGTPSRLETGRPRSGLAVWSHDGKRIAFTSAGDLYSVPASGGHADLILKAPSGEQPLRLQDWSQDGRFLIYYTPDSKTKADVWWLSLPDGKKEPFLNSTANEWQAQLSPDGQWLAYASDETGQAEVYVQRFPKGDTKTKISVSGGVQPQWRRDGKELFYLSLQNKLMSIEVHSASSQQFRAAREVFTIPWRVSVTPTTRRNDYAVGRDGARFLFSAPLLDPAVITVRFNWTSRLPR